MEQHIIRYLSLYLRLYPYTHTYFCIVPKEITSFLNVKMPWPYQHLSISQNPFHKSFDKGLKGKMEVGYLLEAKGAG